jgi:Spx/MgsR family transcriptional regulator
MLTMLGIPNCDTIRKAKAFLTTNGVDFTFRDVRKQPLDAKEWQALVEADADNKIINTRGPAFRKLGVDKDTLDANTKVAVLVEQPAAMKRPVMVDNGALQTIGFSEELYQRFLS